MFTLLHIHTTKGSLLDSILTVEEAVKFASENGMKAMAITDHGSMASFVDFVKECNKYNIKPIIGNEIYEVDDMWEKADTKEYTQLRYHLILLARTQEGYKNLIKITSVSRTEGLYKKPRIDIKYIQENGLGKGIICLTACQAGRLSRCLVNGKYEEAEQHIDKLKNTFDYVVCELQSHNTDDQANANKLIYDFSQKHNLPYTITTDAHMLSDSLKESHAMFVEIGEGREVGESYTDCYLQTESEIYEKLSDQFSEDVIRKGIEESVNITDIIENIDIGLNKGNIMPKINIENGYENHEEYLRYLVFKTFDEKFGHMSKEDQEIRRQRLETELPVLYAVDYTDYFIMLYMLAKEARKRKIPLGYSRGSGANCLCLFMLNVTQIDSVRWDLDFSRFANLGRKSMADFDWDISKRRRKEMVEISEELFGKENVAPIATFNTLSTKVAIRDIGKVLDEKDYSPYYKQIPYKLRDEVAKMIPTIKTLNDLGEEEEKDVLLKDILNKNEKLKEVYEKFPLWFKYVMDVEGLPKSMGRHAAGTLITPTPVTDYCPLCYDSEKNIMIELEMHNAMDDLGLVKMDYLGLETLDIVDDTLKMAGITWDDVDINHLNLEDKEVFEKVYKNGNTVGIFQMESAEGRRMCIEAKADNVEDVIVVNAANRPGTKESFPTYCQNKLYPENVSVLHEDLRELFGKTHYILLYQEQALQLFRHAGFPEEQVDNARRAIGKKKKEVMEQLEVDFRVGLTKKGWNNEQLIEIWQLMLKQAEYCFNRGHAVAYGLLSYLTAYLKTHYTIYFMAALLTSKSDKVQKISIVINDCKRLGIKVSPPNVNKSDIEFTALPENNEILFGLLAVKGLGESIVDKIIENRPYQSMNDFIEKVADKTAIITLIKAGAIPTKDKMLSLKKYANKLFERRDYKPVTTLPSPYSKLIPFGLNVDDYRDGKKVNREALLIDYNKAKEKLFIEEQNQKYKNHMIEFQEKYAKDEYIWEFDTLSMFLTNDPLKDAYKYTKTDWDMLKPLGVTYTMIKKLLTDEPNPVLLKQQLEENPYILTKINGLGFKKVDDLALKLKPELINATERLVAFIKYYFTDLGEGSGHTWCSVKILKSAISNSVPECADKTDWLLENNEILHISEDRVGLKYYHDIEMQIYNMLLEKSKKQTDINISDEKIEQAIRHAEEEQGFQYVVEQLDTINKSLHRTISLITGKAGTGKTSIMRAIVKAYTENQFTLTASALSAMAAQRITEATSFPAMTIHRTLGCKGLNKFDFNKDNHLITSVAFLDEGSMVNASLFLHWLEAIDDNTRIIISGDHKQLPPIGFGNVFSDLIEIFDDEVVSKLVKPMRQAEKSGILVDANLIRENINPITEKLQPRIIHGELQDMYYMFRANRQSLFDIAVKTFLKSVVSDGIDNVVIAVPRRKDCLNSTNELNKTIQEKLLGEVLQSISGSEMTFKLGAKVMQTVNDYDKNVFNGEIGYITEISERQNGKKKEEYCVATYTDIFGKEKLIEYTKKELTALDLAYAMTVHKLQGASRKIVIGIIDNTHHQLLDNCMLYTLLTRAKKRCLLLAEPQAFLQCIRTSYNKRNTWMMLEEKVA